MSESGGILIRTDKKVRTFELDPLFESTVTAGPGRFHALVSHRIYESALDWFLAIADAVELCQIRPVIRCKEPDINKISRPIDQLPEELVHTMLEFR